MTLCKGGIGPILGNVGTIEGRFMPKLYALSQIEQSWHHPRVELGHNLAKWALSEPTSGQVGIIGNNLAQRWIRLEKLSYGVGMVHNFAKKWSYCVGVVLTFHYHQKRFGPTFAKLTFCEVELIKFRAMWALSEVSWAQN